MRPPLLVPPPRAGELVECRTSLPFSFSHSILSMSLPGALPAVLVRGVLGTAASPAADAWACREGAGTVGSIRLAAGMLSDAGLTLPYLGKGPGKRICRMRDGVVRAKKGTMGCSGSTWQHLMGAADFN